ncbi:cobalt ABC transporter inner membrane subunit CbiQ [Neobacillus bataviensis LMG 21833]|uniref:Cobalt ABC transporter inner membrane subunit CbiQ n=1 Tax=Neobacillus bataviensis LMG 21833 TaxID=1117379 RepID=K6DSR7_9BACI|nr:energy-coupling factor transporter transmembrane component T [Neobacillus bataviensis]EKN71399.1 cobalt ABC transporter inner membrane subunit CbiQ [Neobacillus bataviensis LMG 21833]
MISLPNHKVKVVMSLLMIILGVLPKELLIIGGNLVIGTLLLLIYRVPIQAFIKQLKPIAFFMLFTFLFFPLYEGGHGWIKALQYSGRLLFVAQVLTFMFYRMGVPAFLQVLAELRLPAIFIELIMFTLRFMDVFRGEVRHMLLSLRSRGFYTGHWFQIKKYRVLGGLLGSLLLRSFQRSERIYLGMLSKGYKGERKSIRTESVPKYEWLHGVLWVGSLLSLFFAGGKQ